MTSEQWFQFAACSHNFTDAGKKHEHVASRLLQYLFDAVSRQFCDLLTFDPAEVIDPNRIQPSFAFDDRTIAEIAGDASGIECC